MILRKTLDHSTKATCKVRENRILSALRIDVLMKRFDNAVDAHSATFHWLVGNDGNESVTSSSDSTTDNTSDGAHSEQNADGFIADQFKYRSKSPSDANAEVAPINTSRRGQQINGVQTCHTGAARDAIAAWLEKGDEVFHVSGSGKSTLVSASASSPGTRRRLLEWGMRQGIGDCKFLFRETWNQLTKDDKRSNQGPCLLNLIPSARAHSD
ncbi:hypothetical protein BJY04DRAFT_221265 [Aspergillus karnatakaensis]|uniref:uncharacterized protein n=1 Tax=Aspergillus karnatakaensis TaxID=1810916 RepID=UPI003CCDF6D4